MVVETVDRYTNFKIIIKHVVNNLNSEENTLLVRYYIIYN